MQLITIASSSAGNCTAIVDKGSSILIDCGISLKRIKEAIRDFHIPIPSAIFITHSHGDHLSGAESVAKKFSIPIYAHMSTVKERPDSFEGRTIINIEASTQYSVGNLTAVPFSSKHDVYSLNFVVLDSKGKKLCYITDSGSISKVMRLALKNSDAIFIECDYDEEEMKKTSEYDDLLKARITCDYGHLSTQKVLKYLQTVDITKIEHIVIGHLSSTTNSKELVLKRFAAAFPGYMSKFIVAPFEGALEI